MVTIIEIYNVKPVKHLWQNGTYSWLHRSTDEGATWAHMPVGAKGSDYGWSVWQHGSFAFFGVNAGTPELWKSSDSGASWDRSTKVKTPSCSSSFSSSCSSSQSSHSHSPSSSPPPPRSPRLPPPERVCAFVVARCQSS